MPTLCPVTVIKLRIVAAMVLGILLQPGMAVAESLSGAARVFSGDTVIVRGAKVRLFGIEAPGPQDLCAAAADSWPCGAESKAALRDRVNGKVLNCTLLHKVGHGYWQASCELAGDDVAEAQVRSGWARAVPAMTDAYIQAETAASGARRGLWR